MITHRSVFVSHTKPTGFLPFRSGSRRGSTTSFGHQRLVRDGSLRTCPLKFQGGMHGLSSGTCRPKRTRSRHITTRTRLDRTRQDVKTQPFPPPFASPPPSQRETDRFRSPPPFLLCLRLVADRRTPHQDGRPG